MLTELPPKQHKRQRRKFFCYNIGLILLLCCIVECNRQVLVPGKIILGGLFPVHEAGRNASTQCGRIKADQGVQRLVAMLFALDAINRNPNILPGIQLGAQILDTW